MKEMGDEFSDTARRAAKELAVREWYRILIDQKIRFEIQDGDVVMWLCVTLV